MMRPVRVYVQAALHHWGLLYGKPPPKRSASDVGTREARRKRNTTDAENLTTPGTLTKGGGDD